MKSFTEFTTVNENEKKHEILNFDHHAYPIEDENKAKTYHVRISEHKPGWKNENQQVYKLTTKANNADHAKHIAHDTLRRHHHGLYRALTDFHSRIHSVEEDK